MNAVLNYFGSPIWFAQISTRGMTLDKLLLPRASTFFALQVMWGSLVSAIAYFGSLKAHNSVNFQPICKILVSKLFHNLRDKVLFP